MEVYVAVMGSIIMGILGGILYAVCVCANELQKINKHLKGD